MSGHGTPGRDLSLRSSAVAASEQVAAELLPPAAVVAPAAVELGRAAVALRRVFAPAEFAGLGELAALLVLPVVDHLESAAWRATVAVQVARAVGMNLVAVARDSAVD